MNRFGEKPEVLKRSDTSTAKLKMKSSGYGKESSVAEESGKES